DKKRARGISPNLLGLPLAGAGLFAQRLAQISGILLICDSAIADNLPVLCGEVGGFCLGWRILSQPRGCSYKARTLYERHLGRDFSPFYLFVYLIFTII
ncbi:hypothetical protein, partial [Candidatus Chlorohelix sp.]|uniref:hypothetical protein n=1 Tax=Candidatus Chlorohelix sp. TaxID=3139201 RepID=UPI0030377708